MGRVVHFELLAEDPARAVNFYKEALGWDVDAWGGSQSYWLVRTGAREQPGIDGAIMGKHFAQGVINTVEVESLQDTTVRIERAGGKRVHGPSDIPGVGTHAYFEDTEGNLFGVLEPKR
jgi:predicted enzyme related to lactoylglutathione lyase